MNSLLHHLLLICFLWVLGAAGQTIDVANVTEVQRLGALVKQPKDVYLIRNTIVVTLNCSHLSDAILGLQNLSNELLPLQSNIKTLMAKENNHSQIPEGLLMNWQGKLQAVEEMLDSILMRVRPGITSSKRVKRGLFNIFGSISKFFFGVATEGDIEGLRDDILALKTNQGRLVTAVNAQSALLHEHKEKILAIAGKVNEVAVALNSVTESFDILHDSLIVSAQVDALADGVMYYKTYFETMVANLNLAARNIVSPTLFSYAELAKVIILALTDFGLTPAFPLHELQSYYPLLQAELSPGLILLSVPFIDTQNFTLWEIIPFPSWVEDKHVILTNVSELVIVSKDLHYLAMPSLEELDSCHELYDHLYCEPQNVILAPFAPTCEWDIIQDNTNLNKCAYQEIELVDTVFQRIGYSLFVYSPQTTPAMIQCPEGQPQGLTLQGRHQIAVDCTITTPGANYLGKRISYGYSVNLRPQRLSPIKWEDIANREIVLVSTLAPLELDDAGLVHLISASKGLSHYVIGVFVSLAVIVVFLILMGYFMYAQRKRLTTVALEAAAKPVATYVRHTAKQSA